ncbi:hypothetical protein GCM10009791_28160 [Citricoccus zhacaiensis]
MGRSSRTAYRWAPVPWHTVAVPELQRGEAGGAANGKPVEMQAEKLAKAPIRNPGPAPVK